MRAERDRRRPPAPLSARALDGPRAAGPRDAVIANAGVIVWGRRATGETAELARPAREAVGAVGHEQGSGSQVGGSLGLSAGPSGQELRGRRAGHRGRDRRRLGHGRLREREEGEKGQEDENGLLHRFISAVDGPAGSRPPPRGCLESGDSVWAPTVETPRGASPGRRRRSQVPRRARGASERERARSPPQRRPAGRLYSGGTLPKRPLRGTGYPCGAGSGRGDL